MLSCSVAVLVNLVRQLYWITDVVVVQYFLQNKYKHIATVQTYYRPITIYSVEFKNSGDESHFLGMKIRSTFQKWNELNYVLSDHHIHLPTRVKFLTARVRSHLLYSL